MNTFTYELIEQLDAQKGDADSELSVLGNTREKVEYRFSDKADMDCHFTILNNE